MTFLSAPAFVGTGSKRVNSFFLEKKTSTGLQINSFNSLMLVEITWLFDGANISKTRQKIKVFSARVICDRLVDIRDCSVEIDTGIVAGIEVVEDLFHLIGTEEALTTFNSLFSRYLGDSFLIEINFVVMNDKSGLGLFREVICVW